MYSSELPVLFHQRLFDKNLLGPQTPLGQASWYHLIFNNTNVVNDGVIKLFLLFYYKKDHRNESKAPVPFLVITKHIFLLMSFRPCSVYVVVSHS